MYVVDKLGISVAGLLLEVAVVVVVVLAVVVTVVVVVVVVVAIIVILKLRFARSRVDGTLLMSHSVVALFPSVILSVKSLKIKNSGSSLARI